MPGPGGRDGYVLSVPRPYGPVVLLTKDLRPHPHSLWLVCRRLKPQRWVSSQKSWA